MNLTDTDKADLRAAQANFAALMKGLTPKQQLDRAHVLAAGMRESDPLTKALAQQLVDLNKLNGSIETAKAELAKISKLNLNGENPRQTKFRAETLARKHDLEQQIQRDMAAAIGIHEAKLEGPQRKAVEHFRALRARDDRQARISEAVARKKAEREQAEIDEVAEKIVFGGIRNFPKGHPAGHDLTAGDSQ